MRGEILWKEFITEFTPHIIRIWQITTVTEWHDLLMQRGLYLDPDWERSTVEAIVDIFYQESYVTPKLKSKIQKPDRNDEASDTNNYNNSKMHCMVTC